MLEKIIEGADELRERPSRLQCSRSRLVASLDKHTESSASTYELRFNTFAATNIFHFLFLA